MWGEGSPTLQNKGGREETTGSFRFVEAVAEMQPHHQPRVGGGEGRYFPQGRVNGMDCLPSGPGSGPLLCFQHPCLVLLAPLRALGSSVALSPAFQPGLCLEGAAIRVPLVRDRGPLPMAPPEPPAGQLCFLEVGTVQEPLEAAGPLRPLGRRAQGPQTSCLISVSWDFHEDTAGHQRLQLKGRPDSVCWVFQESCWLLAWREQDKSPQGN